MMATLTSSPPLFESGDVVSRESVTYQPRWLKVVLTTQLKVLTSLDLLCFYNGTYQSIDRTISVDQLIGQLWNKMFFIDSESIDALDTTYSLLLEGWTLHPTEMSDEVDGCIYCGKDIGENTHFYTAMCQCCHIHKDCIEDYLYNYLYGDRCTSCGSPYN